MPKHPTPTLQSWGIIPAHPHRHPRQAGAEVRAEGTFSEAARHLETSAASCETNWLLAFAANNKKTTRRRGSGSTRLGGLPGPAGGPGQVHACAALSATNQDYNSRRATHAHRTAPCRAACLPEVEPRAGGVSDLCAAAAAAGAGSQMRSSDAGDGFGWRRRLRGRRARGGPPSPAALLDRRERRHRERQGKGLGGAAGPASHPGRPRNSARPVGPQSRGRPPPLAAARCPPAHLPGVDRAGGGGAAAVAGQAGSTSLYPEAPPQAPGWPDRSWSGSALPPLMQPSALPARRSR